MSPDEAAMSLTPDRFHATSNSGRRKVHRLSATLPLATCAHRSPSDKTCPETHRRRPPTSGTSTTGWPKPTAVADQLASDCRTRYREVAWFPPSLASRLRGTPTRP